MLKLKIQKNKHCSQYLICSKIKKKSTIPNKIGIIKLYKYMVLKYNLILLLQKYGLRMSKGLRKFCLINLCK